MKGGFEKGTPQKGGALIVLYGTELEPIQQSIEKAGGLITKEIFEFPGGKRFHFEDLDGYEFAVWSEISS